MENSARNNERNFFIDQGAVSIEVRTQLKNALGNRERLRGIVNHPSIYATLIIGVLEVKVRNQIHASRVDWRITPLQIVRNQII